ncbi:hypothetical protein L226DRAFT_528089 [Lentinus tigrinus ALCF2SS1-7]|uniref:uncharacterized protein n=1 Tax=Lentinus tigrinus ALCF2SS1-7 TaxID=1328758 RepID=UPI001165CA51|nr:hypothetical protein L226DRAFT_528089 [Lentinus tigrinus ALCF2SS1-7]
MNSGVPAWFALSDEQMGGLPGVPVPHTARLSSPGDLTLSQCRPPHPQLRCRVRTLRTLVATGQAGMAT